MLGSNDCLCMLESGEKTRPRLQTQLIKRSDFSVFSLASQPAVTPACHTLCSSSIDVVQQPAVSKRINV